MVFLFFFAHVSLVRKDGRSPFILDDECCDEDGYEQPDLARDEDDLDACSNYHVRESLERLQQSQSDIASEAESQSWSELASLAAAMEDEWTDAQPRDPPPDGSPTPMAGTLPSSPTGASQADMALRMLKLVQQKARELLGWDQCFQTL